MVRGRGGAPGAVAVQRCADKGLGVGTEAPRGAEGMRWLLWSERRSYCRVYRYTDWLVCGVVPGWF